MKIIIAGAGEVGTHLAKLLLREEQDIVLIDQSWERLRSLDSFNLMTFQGDPTCIRTLKEAGIKGAYLFIAVMPDEGQNITSSILASNLGAQHTLARVGNDEYILEENSAFFDKLGVNSMIYPEQLAAKEIVDSLNRNWTRDWWEAGGGALRMVAIRVRENAVELVWKPLSQLTENGAFYHVTAINRDGRTIIPGGRDSIQPGDIVYFMVMADQMESLKKLCAKESQLIKKVMIVGGSRIAQQAIRMLPDKKFIVLDHNEEKIEQMFSPFSNVLSILADGRKSDELEHAGVGHVDAFIALTDSSEANILACLSAKRYGVGKTVAEVENSDYIMAATKLDIGTIINKKIIAASQIYRLLLKHNVVNMKCLKHSEAEVAEMVARPGSKVTRELVRNLNLPKELVLGGLIRSGEGMLINGDTMIQPNDTVIVFFFGTAISKIEKYFN